MAAVIRAALLRYRTVLRAISADRLLTGSEHTRPGPPGSSAVSCVVPVSCAGREVGEGGGRGSSEFVRIPSSFRPSHMNFSTRGSTWSFWRKGVSGVPGYSTLSLVKQCELGGAKRAKGGGGEGGGGGRGKTIVTFCETDLMAESRAEFRAEKKDDILCCCCLSIRPRVIISRLRHGASKPFE